MKLFFTLVVFVSQTAFASLSVNRLNGGASLLYIDFTLRGPIAPLELARLYTSLTAINEKSGWNGAFGWGWSAPFETAINVTPDKTILLRDGGTANTLFFRSPKDRPEDRDQLIEQIKRAYFEKLKGRTVSEAELKQLILPEKLLNKLKADSSYRSEMATRYGFKFSANVGLLVSSEYGFQTIQLKDGLYVRQKDDLTQSFDKEGRLVRQKMKNGFTLEYKYSPTQKFQLVEISDGDKNVGLKFTWRGGRISEITDNKGHRTRYTYDGVGNLTQVIDSENQVFGYRYENKRFPHLLTRIDYVSESKGKEASFREIKYDENGLVASTREPDGSQTEYQYGRNQSEPENNFWTKSITKQAGATGQDAIQEFYDEYWIKLKADGARYLHKQETRAPGTQITTIFTACCGKPLQVTKNGQVTQYKYYEDGQLKEKLGPGMDLKIEYDPKWKKISKIIQNGTSTEYSYDDRGNLVRASNNKNEKITLSYDKQGRIYEMIDGAGRNLAFQYNNNGKPSVITEKGLGTLRLQYDSRGKIKKTEVSLVQRQQAKASQAKSQEVIRRVMQGFQQLLDIIRPSTLVSDV